MKKGVIITILILFSLICSSVITVKAETLSDNINEQLGNIDFSEANDFLESLHKDEYLNLNGSFIDQVSKILNGEYNCDYKTIFNLLLNNLVDNVNKTLPSFISVIAIALFYSIISNSKSSRLSSSTKNVIYFACYSAICLLVLSKIFSLISNVKIIIEQLTNLINIMSPIILTLMGASGGTVSVAVYKPAVAFLSNGIIGLISGFILPVVSILIIFSVITSISDGVKLNKFIDFFASLIKWILGISLTVFAFFISIQGITSGVHDGVSLRATKYAISNSVPIVGGFLKDGFDLVIAGSVLIKNAVGLSAVFILFAIIISPLLNLISVQLMLKLVSAIIEPLGEKKLSDFCVSISKSLNYLTASLLLIGFMVFITFILLICSANIFL